MSTLANGLKKILIVEDDPDIANLYSLVLKRSDYDVLIVENGKDALASVLSFKPDLILLDIMIPDIDGLSVLQTIRTAPEYSKMQPKVLVMTNLARQDVRERAKNYGVQGYIVKANIVPSDLLTIIQNLSTEA